MSRRDWSPVDGWTDGMLTGVRMLGGGVAAGRRTATRSIALAHADLDIADAAAVDDALAEYRPDAVVNCAAFTDVDGAEDDEAARCGSTTRARRCSPPPPRGSAPRSSTRLERLRLRWLRRAAVRRVRMPSAISAYGRSKQAGETSVAVANPRHFIVRSSWLYGVGGRTSSRRCSAWADEQPEVSSCRIRSVSHLRGPLGRRLVDPGRERDSGIHHIAGGGPSPWYEFAQEIFDQAGSSAR